jgi:Ca2+-binding RTX toxin-like protein
VGESGGTLRAWRREGNGSYTAMDGASGRPANPFAGIDVGIDSAPSFADLDADGDLDLVVGESGGTLRVFTSFAGDDSLSGGSGNDTLSGGAGNDSLAGDGGTDLVSFAELTGATQAITVDLAAQRVTGATGADTLSGIEGALGGAGNDSLLGDGNANALSGGLGDDMLAGGAGGDTLAGGAGDDLFYVTDGGDVVLELVGGGADTIITSVSMTMAHHVEAMHIASGISGITLTGGAGNDVLVGNGLANTFVGGAGDDLILAGNVTLADIYALFTI